LELTAGGSTLLFPAPFDSLRPSLHYFTISLFHRGSPAGFLLFLRADTLFLAIP
jgi:hypothetical protein